MSFKRNESEYSDGVSEWDADMYLYDEDESTRDESKSKNRKSFNKKAEVDETPCDENIAIEIDETMLPKDSFSFLILYDPINEFRCFFFGLGIVIVQTALLSLLLLATAAITDSESPMDGKNRIFPGDTEPLVKITQVLSMATFVVVGNNAMSDLIVAGNMFYFLTKNEHEEISNLRFVCSNLLRFLQGCFALAATFFVIFSSVTVQEVILNLLAVDFISHLDDLAFSNAINGYYGKEICKGAKKISQEKLPLSVIKKKRKFPFFRKSLFIFSCLISSMIGAGFLLYQQEKGVFLTSRFRVEFNNDFESNEYDKYSACYSKTKTKNDNRFIYDFFDGGNNDDNIEFQYCKKENRWVLFENGTDPCSAFKNRQEDGNNELLAYSTRSTSFDIENLFLETWFTPDDFVIPSIKFLTKDTEWTDDQCGRILGDGTCDMVLNEEKYSFDKGDCCGATCEGVKCGRKKITEVFNITSDVKPQHNVAVGFPNCIDHSMVPINITIGSITTKFMNSGGELRETLRPELLVTCESKPILKVFVFEQYMSDTTTTIYIKDGSECSLLIQNEIINDQQQYHDLEYEIYDIENPSKVLLMHKDTNHNQGNVVFKVLPKCFKAELFDIVNASKVYSDPTSTEMKTINWLLEEDKTYTSNKECPKRLVEKYALISAHLQLGVITGKWIKPAKSQCEWKDEIVCDEDGSVGNVLKLDLFSSNLNGNFPLELGLLTKLTFLSLYTNEVSGTIPTEIGELTELKSLILGKNKFTGTIPSEIGKLTKLRQLVLLSNRLSGKIPSEIGNLGRLRILTLQENQLTGTIPSNLGRLTRIEKLRIDNNMKLTGTVPSEFGGLTSLAGLNLTGTELKSFKLTR